MKKFAIYKHPDGRTQVIKEGFSFPAFLLPIGWSVYKRMWKFSGLLFLMMILFNALDHSIVEAGGSIIDNDLWVANLLFHIGIGWSANKILEKHVKEHGFDKIDVVKAENADMALARHIKGDVEFSQTYKEMHFPR